MDTKGHNSLWGRVYAPEGLGVTLKAEGGGTGAKTGLYRVALTERRTEESKRIRRETMKKEGKDWSPRRGKELVPRTDGLGNCLTVGQTKEHLLLEGKRQISRCLVSTYYKGYLTRGPLVEQDMRIRKLTPLECERLMGIPDEWTRYGVMDDEVVEISNTQRYRMAGNGVIPAVVEEILRRLLSG